MARLFGALASVVFLVLSGGAASAQEAPTVEDLEEKYAGTTFSDWEDEGFQLAEECVSATDVGAPPEAGAMGFHAVNPDRIDTEIEPLEPEVLVVDENEEVIAVEYEMPTRDVERPSVFDHPFDESEGHPGIEQPHYDLHVWFMENPAGQFEAFNPDASCPEAETAGAEESGEAEEAADEEVPEEMPATGAGAGVVGLGFGGATLLGTGALSVLWARRQRS